MNRLVASKGILQTRTLDRLTSHRRACLHARRAKCSTSATHQDGECSTSRSPIRPTTSSGYLTAGAVATLAVASSLLAPEAAFAFELHSEPSNALTLPTWAIHVSSVLEWVTAMGLMWKYAEATDNPRWKGMAWGMVPSLGSAMAACTWHFFYNSPDLEFLVVLQSALTVIGNCTCWWAAYRIYEAAVAEKSSA